MISLEQIRLLEGKISRAIELIRVLKDENATLRRGLDSAQKRMRELESLVDGFKADQKEIESVIVRTLRHLDDLEDTPPGPPQEGTEKRVGALEGTEKRAGARTSAPAQQIAAAAPSEERPRAAAPQGEDPPAATPKDELDIF